MSPILITIIVLYSLISLVFILLIIVAATDDMFFINEQSLQREDFKSGQTVPKIMHQTWKTKILREDHNRYREEWKKKLSNWKHILYTDADLEEFVKKEFAWYLPIWERLIPKIKKIDTVRYMLLYKYGGIYADLDMRVKDIGFISKHLQSRHFAPPIAFITSSRSRRDWRYNTDVSSPAFIASQPGHVFWLDMLQYIAENYDKYVIEATGPVAMSNVLRNWKGEQSVVLLSLFKFGMGWGSPLVKNYTQHVNTNHSTWKQHIDFNERSTYDHTLLKPITEKIQHIRRQRLQIHTESK